MILRRNNNYAVSTANYRERSGRRPSKSISNRIILASDRQLRDPIYLTLLAVAVWSLKIDGKYSSRLTVADIVSCVLRDFEGVFVKEDGSIFVIDDVDKLLGGPHFDWLRDFFEVPFAPGEWNFNQITLDRLRVIDGAIKAGGPRLWRGQLN